MSSCILSEKIVSSLSPQVYLYNGADNQIISNRQCLTSDILSTFHKDLLYNFSLMFIFSWFEMISNIFQWNFPNPNIIVYHLEICKIKNASAKPISSWCQFKPTSFFPYIVTIMFEVRRFFLLFISNENFRNFQHVSVRFSHLKL